VSQQQDDSFEASFGKPLQPVSRLLSWKANAVQVLEKQQSQQRAELSSAPGLPNWWKSNFDPTRKVRSSSKAKKPATGDDEDEETVMVPLSLFELFENGLHTVHSLLCVA
jgi:hypothetical protein